jgi:excisionase family DNA binding protein
VPEPISVRIPDAVRMTGMSRSRIYLLIASGELKTAKVGRCTLILVSALREYIERHA